MLYFSIFDLCYRKSRERRRFNSGFDFCTIFSDIESKYSHNQKVIGELLKFKLKKNTLLPWNISNSRVNIILCFVIAQVIESNTYSIENKCEMRYVIVAD